MTKTPIQGSALRAEDRFSRFPLGAHRQVFWLLAMVCTATNLIMGCDWGSKDKQGPVPAVGANEADSPSTSENADASKTADSAIADSVSAAKPGTSGAASELDSARDSSAARRSSDAVEPKTETVPQAPDSDEQQQKAKQLILSCIDHYRDSKSYEDAAVFKLKVPYPTDPVEEEVPCRIAFERPNKLALHVESLRSSWTPETFESILDQTSSDGIPNQRLVRPLPETISIDWLLRDHLGQQLINPMFGLPLNIGFLLDESGSKAFIDEVTTRWLSPAEMDGVQCERIQLTLQDVSWVYWIDEPNRILMRQEFPHAVLGGLLLPIPATVAPSEIVCQIDYKNIKFDERIDWTTWTIKPQQSDLQLRRFIPAPLRDVPLQMGRVVKPFSLNDVDEKPLFDFAERQAKVTSFHFIDDSEESRSYIDELYSVRRQLKERGVDQDYETILVSDRPAERMAAVLAAWNCTLPFGTDSQRTLADQLGVKATPATVVIGSDNRIQHFSEKRLPLGMVVDVPLLVKEVDLATIAFKNAVQNEARYTAQLHRFVLAREELNKLPPDYQEIAQFPFVFHDIQPDWKITFEDGIVAAMGEPFLVGLESSNTSVRELYADSASSVRVMTVLDDAGNLWAIDQRGERAIVAKLPVESTVNAKRFWIYPDPWKHEHIYIVPEGLPRYWFTVAPRGVGGNWSPLEVEQFPLLADETILNAAWCLADGQPAFCVVTSASRIIALNPATQRSSVAVESNPQKNAISSIMPRLNSKGAPIAWSAVRADGAIEFIESQVPTSELGPPKPLMFKPEFGLWLWGVTPDGPRLVGLAKLPSAETAAVVLDDKFQSLSTQALATRPEQCRLLASTTSESNAFYFLMTAPNRVLHLQAIGGKFPDQMSFGRRIFGASIHSVGESLRIVVAMEGEVSSWTVRLKE
ncbi:peroxiredoxin family protein [Pirellulaceae bacterium SH449]